MASSVRAALLPIEPNLPANEFRPLQQLVDKAGSPRRFVVLVLGGVAMFALVLASLDGSPNLAPMSPAWWLGWRAMLGLGAWSDP